MISDERRYVMTSPYGSHPYGSPAPPSSYYGAPTAQPPAAKSRKPWVSILRILVPVLLFYGLLQAALDGSNTASTTIGLVIAMWVVLAIAVTMFVFDWLVVKRPATTRAPAFMPPPAPPLPPVRPYPPTQAPYEWPDKQLYEDEYQEQPEAAPAADEQTGPVVVLMPDNGVPPMIDDSTRPKWVEMAVDAGMDVDAEIPRNKPDHIRFTATGEYPVSILRVQLSKRRR